MQTYETIADAVLLAKEIEAGAIDPFVGCGLIAAISERNSSPGLLSMFELLAHEQSGHQHIGITAQSTLPHIMEACRAFLASQV